MVKAQGEDSEDIAKKHGFYPVHRLDRDTGGLIVYALTEKAASELSKQITEGRVRKEYLTVLAGEIQPESGRLEDLLYHDRVKNKSYVVTRERGGVRKAVLDYTAEAHKEGMTLASVSLVTGRTHQIRVQFASRKTPVCGDSRYGGRADCRLALWSHRLSFISPDSGRRVEFTSLPPAKDYPWSRFSDCVILSDESERNTQK